MGMFRTAFAKRSYSRFGLDRIIIVAHCSKPLGVKPGTSGRSVRSPFFWTRWCCTFASRNSREMDDVRSSKMSRIMIREGQVSSISGKHTMPWIGIIGIMGISIKLLHLFGQNNDAVFRLIVLNLFTLVVGH